MARFSRSLLPPPPVCLSVRKALGLCRSVPGVPRARVPLPLASWRASLGWVLTSACDTPLAAWLPCSVVCPGFVLLCLLSPNSPRISCPFRADALRCLILLIILIAFSVYPAHCTHSGTGAKTSAWFASPGSFYCPPLLAVPACSATGPPGYCLTTHPCLTIGAHAVMVCVVVIQAHLHPRPPSLPSAPLSPCLFVPFPLPPCHPVEPSFRPLCHPLQVPLPILVHAARLAT